MTANEFKYTDGWYPVGRLSGFSSQNDSHLDFLQAITRFRQTVGDGIPGEGFPMPDILNPAVEVEVAPVPGIDQRRIVVEKPVSIGNVVGIDFVPDDLHAFLGGRYTDGVIIFKPAPVQSNGVNLSERT